jgi:hypothetical protein
MSKLNDGFATLITFARIPSAKFYEKTVTPPSISIGKAIDTTTMRNLTMRTTAAAKLQSTGNMKLDVAYDTQSYQQVQAVLGLTQLVIVTFSDASSVSFYGYIDSFAPGVVEEGKQPTATIEVIATNTKTSGTESAPVWV